MDTIDLDHPIRILSADLSLRRPAFAELQVDPESKSIRLLSVIDVDNRKHNGPISSMLERIYNVTYELAENADVLVRERGFSRFSRDTQTLFRVVGVSDLAAWKSSGKLFEEIPPTTVKKLVAGKGNASKEEVAKALEQIVGWYEYDSHDGSDAVAVGAAWLLGRKIVSMEGLNGNAEN